MIDHVKTFAYGTLVVVVDFIARPLFWAIHYKRR